MKKNMEIEKEIKDAKKVCRDYKKAGDEKAYRQSLGRLYRALEDKTIEELDK